MSIVVLDISLFGFDRNTSLSLSTFGYLSGSTLPPGIDYCELAKSRLAEQFKESILLQGLICAFLSEVQDLETVFLDLKTNRSVDTAVGQQLEELALIVDTDITGLTEEDSRAKIRFQIGINTSNGEPETVITYVKEITNATFVRYTEVYPAKIHIFTDGDVTPFGLNQSVQQVAPAGVGVEIVSSYGDPTPFAVAPEGGIPDPDGLGFGEINLPLEGGSISEKIIS